MGGKLSQVSRPRAKSGLSLRPLADGCAIIDLDTEAVHILNSSAAYVLSLCDGTRTAPVIAAELREAVPTLSKSQARTDVNAALLLMSEKGLLGKRR